MISTSRLFSVIALTALICVTSVQARLRGGMIVASGDDYAARSVAVMVPDDQGSITTCTGTLIGPRTVLTAAHCIAPDRRAFVVFLTHIELTTGLFSTATPVEKASVPAKYVPSPETEYDIAVLRLSGDAPAGYRVSPLYRAQQKIADGQTMTVAAYGNTGDPAIDQNGTEDLRQEDFKVTTDAMTDRMLSLLGDQQHGLDHGDSGAGIFTTSNGQTWLAGVAKAKYLQCSAGFCKQASFTRLDNPETQDWINEMITRQSHAPQTESTSAMGSITYLYTTTP